MVLVEMEQTTGQGNVIIISLRLHWNEYEGIDNSKLWGHSSHHNMSVTFN